MANTIVTQRDTQLERQRAGFLALSLINLTNDDEPAIAEGSVVEISGTLYSVTSTESITGWAGISNGPAWVKVIPDGVNPFTAEYTDVAPTWFDSKQGWYDGTGTERYVAGLTKTGASEYAGKFVISPIGRGEAANFFGFSRLDILSAPGSGAWVTPNGVYRLKVTVIAGGGGGGGSGEDYSGGTGGGGAGVAIKYLDTTPGQSFSYTVGAGGAGGAAGNTHGANGDSSVFNSTISASAGTSGRRANDDLLVGGFGGQGSGGDMNLYGERGGSVYGSYNAGGGGASAMGLGAGSNGLAYPVGGGWTGGNDGNPGRQFGGGGSGGYRFTTSAAGGNGADGGILIEY